VAAADLDRGARASDRLARAIGFGRSLIIYFGQPWRTRGLDRHYAAFLGPDDLAFDVGAHVGNHTLSFARLGARVVAVEPQPAFAAWLRRLFRDQPRITVVESALAATPGVVELYRSPRTPTVATTSPKWIDKVRASGGFKGIRWSEAIEVPALTLDALIARHGLPRFCKIDVEGYEAHILRGLSQPIPLLSFEYVPAAIDIAFEAMALLAALGPYRFNLTIGERRQWRWPAWQDAESVERWLRALRPHERSGDIYARLAEERLSSAQSAQLGSI
jgi:FkbM family methyltransferase